jgi:hypothetical protein
MEIYSSEIFNHLPDYMVPDGHNMNLQPCENVTILQAVSIFLCFLQAAMGSNTATVRTRHT